MSAHDARMAQAIRVAMSSKHRWMVGCVITEGSRVLGHSPNKFRNDPWIDHDHATIHAESAALARVDGGDTAYVARVNRHGEPRLARPCTECLRGLTDWGIRVVVYSIDGNGPTRHEAVAYKIEKIG